MKTSFRIRCMLFVVLLSTTRGGLAFQCQRISARPLSSSKSSSLYSTYFFHSSTTTSLQGSYSSSLSWSRLRMSTSNAQSHDTTSSSSSISQLSSRLPTKSPLTKKVPITLLSGFLGSGKTTTLKHLLENRQGIKVGVVVNDVASVNIDAKLVSSPDNTVGSTSSSSSSSLADGILELQNGCACCSLADELLTTIDTLIESRKINKGDGGGDDNSFDAICVELSGVADPTAIKANWDTAQLQGLGVTQKAELVNVVTLVDASTFGSDFLSWDMAGQRPDWVNPNDECGSDQRKVAELLAEQIEAADILIMNKADIASEEQLRVATALARTINDGAKMEVVEYGKVTPRMILPVHRRQETTDTGGSECTEKAESHCDHGSDCHDHSHSHGHEHQHDDNSHDHSHEHEDQHRHQHHATDTENLGIISFVYRATRPFDTRKLLQVIQTWPVPIKDELDLDPYSLQQENDESDAGSKKIQFQEDAYLGVLRSKGFCWLAPTKWDGPQQDSWRHDTAMYWSHAGKHFGIKAAGRVRYHLASLLPG